MSQIRVVHLTLLILTALAASPAFAQSIPIARADVDRDCTVTRADAAIVQSKIGKRTGQPGYDAAADVNGDGVINNTDLTFVTRNVGAQVCSTPPPAAATIVASVAPATNPNGWHRTDVTVSFACTNAVSCPPPVTVTTEGAGQIVERTAANTAGATATARVTLNIDKTPPAPAAVLPASLLPGGTLAIPVSLAATDLSGLARASLIVDRALADSKTATPFTLAWTAPAAADAIVGLEEQLEIIAEDRAGNTASLRRSVTIDQPDTVGPTVAVSAPATAAPGATVPIVVDAADNRSLARVVLTRTHDSTTTTIEDRTAAPFSFQAIAEIPAGLPAGTVVTFAATATDGAGNTGTGSATLQVVTSVQTTKLEVFVDPPVSPTFQSAGLISGTIGRATTNVAPTAPPIVAGVSPQFGRQGQTLDIVITGINTTFTNQSQVTFGPGLTVTSVTATDATHLTARVTIAGNASLGPRLVAVNTGTQEGLLASAFSVVSGLGTLTGRLLNAQGQPIANAQVCLPGTTTCVTTNVDGHFSFPDVPVDASRVVASAPGYDAASFSLKLSANGTAALGDLALVASNLPPPPPAPNSPPIAPKLATVLGRGATEFMPGGNPDQLRKLIRDSIVAIGGKEMGVLDENGQQLNPLMTGAGYVSFDAEAVEELVNDMIAGDTISFAELFKIFVGSLDFRGAAPLPTLQQLIAGFQDSVDQAWADPSRPDAPLLMLLFNQGRVASPTPPRVNFDTRFNPLQKNLLAVSFITFVHRFLNPPTQSMTVPSPMLDVVPQQRGSGWGDRLRGLASLIKPRSPASASASWAAATTRRGPSVPAEWVRGRVGRDPRTLIEQSTSTAQSTNPYLPDSSPSSRPPSLMWETVMEKVLPAGGWTAAKQAGGLCDQFLVYITGVTPEPGVDGKSPQGKELAKDPLAKFLPAPSCKDAVSLLEILVKSRPEIYQRASEQFGKFFVSENATRESAQRMQQTFKSEAFQKAWQQAKREASTITTQKKLLGMAQGVVEGILSKIQGEVTGSILKLEAELFVMSVRPRSPFLVSVEQQTNPETTPASPSRIVKVEFDRSANDQGIYDTPDITWFYELYRGRSGTIDVVQRREFRKDVKRIAFYDEVPDDGTYVYAVRAVRWVGQPFIQGKTEQSLFDKVLAFLGGFLNTSVSIAGRQVIGVGVVKDVADPLAAIYKGINVQISDMSDPGPIYVSTAPPTPRPPASLAVHPFSGEAYLSVPTLGQIFKVTNGVVSPHAVPNFKQPNQVGLAIDMRGDLYTDNSASDAQFGGRIFRFAHLDGARTLAGSTNYYSMLLQFANPVAVQSMLVAFGPGGEGLFIADSLNQRITRMTLPWSFAPGVTAERNVSQPYAISTLFNFSASTTMAMRPDLVLAVTQQNNVLLVGPSGSYVLPLFSPESGGTTSPYTQLSGVTFDTYGNMYLSDSVLGTITMIPRDNQKAPSGLLGLSPIDLKKLTVLRGSRRPSDLKLTANRDGLAFYDGERAFVSLRFGMAGQVVDGSGSPVGGAQVYVPDQKRLAVTDSDGVFVLPDLVQEGKSPVIDFTVRRDGKTVSYSTVLDVYEHNIVDVVYNPTPPPPPNEEEHVIHPPNPKPPKKTENPETVSVVFDLEVTPQSAPEACPRGVFLSPGFGAGSLTASTLASGLLTTSRFSAALLVVNGNVTPITLTDREFSMTVPLLVGENVMHIALPASALKPLGCADPTLDDATPVSISTTHKVFHDSRPDELQRYRATVGFDLAVRGIVREGGRAIAGLGFHVPGTDYSAISDADGVFQVNLPKGTVAGATTATDALSTQMFTKVGQIVALLRQERRAEALAQLQDLLLQAIAVGDTPPQAAVSADALLAQVLAVEGTARRLIQALEGPDGIPDPADVDALEAIGTQLAATDSNGEIVVRGREYPELSITVRVQ